MQIIYVNYTPLQRSCLENPRDGGAWQAAVCGVAQSRTQLRRLSSSSSSSILHSYSALLGSGPETWGLDHKSQGGVVSSKPAFKAKRAKKSKS